MNGRILILENAQPTLEAINQILIDAGHETTSTDDVATAQRDLSTGGAELLIANTSLAGENVGDFIESIRSAAPGVPIILVVEPGATFIPSEAASRGAYGYVQTPLDPEQLRLLVLRAMEYGQLMRENKALRGDAGALAGRPLAEIEKQVILSTLERFKGHRLRTATALGIGLRTLGMKLKRWKEEGQLIESR
ncbi:MAG TPA: helix-turn-helix domain-containing protein [Tepidisphaeraceae bacterium]|jgi:DNA-binding NtrC family response regulator